MKKYANILFVFLFVASLWLIPAVIFWKGADNKTSYYENRSLAQFPTFTQEMVLAGDFDGIETWLSDHMPLRDYFLTLNTWIDIDLWQKPAVNDIILGDTLLPYNNFGEWDLAYLDPMAEIAVSEQMELQELVASWGGAYCYVGIPMQNTYFNELYPDYTASRDWHIEGMTEAFTQEASVQGLAFLNMMTIFQSQGMPEEYYAKSDHHFTYFGAFVTYQSTMAYLNEQYDLDLPVLTDDDIDIVPLDVEFLGSRNREIYGLWEGEESLYIGLQKEEVPFTRVDNGKEVESTLYTIPQEGVATYTVYMGGDVAETIISTDRPELPNVLIFGDSFTNPLEGLFYTSFNELRSIDLRYYTQEGILSYVAEYQPDVVICIRDDHSYVLNTYNGVIDW